MKSRKRLLPSSGAVKRDSSVGKLATYGTVVHFPGSPWAQDQAGTRAMSGPAVVALGATPYGRVVDAAHAFKVHPSFLDVSGGRINRTSAALRHLRSHVSPSRTRTLILLVNADPVLLRRIDLHLSDEGYRVAAVSSFQLAKEALQSVWPDLLMADIRLGAFNGLHLAARSRLERPSLPVIITHACYDSVLETEAQRLGATFVVNPLQNSEFLSHVRGALQNRGQALPTTRRWPRKQVSAIVEAQAASTPARIVDLSHGGLRLQLRDPGHCLPPIFEMALPSAGITMKACRIWTSRSPATADVWCGAELVDTGASVASQWREFVDSVT